MKELWVSILRVDRSDQIWKNPPRFNRSTSVPSRNCREHCPAGAKLRQWKISDEKMRSKWCNRGRDIATVRQADYRAPSHSSLALHTLTISVAQARL